MAKLMRLLLLLMLHLLIRLEAAAAAAAREEEEEEGLRSAFYRETCPQLENIVRKSVHSSSLFDPTTPAALLRLLFHDCQVQGCDASILVDSASGSEMGSSRNFGVRKSNNINLIKAAVERACPAQVSCSDILVLAAREAVSLSGGPTINVPLGRRDSSIPPTARRAESSLPPNNIALDQALDLFWRKGMTIEETVAILGAHTLGVTHCFSLRSRLYTTPAGAGNALMHDGFVNALKLRCPAHQSTSASKIAFVSNDLTPVLFDNDYFVNTMRGRGVLNVDAALPLDSRTRPFVIKFAADRNAFYTAFSSAFIKLSSSNVLTGNQGVIRRSCNRFH